MSAATTKDAEVIETTSESMANVPPPAGVALVPFDGVRMRLSPREARRRFDELQVYITECLQPGVDFGLIPGTDKRTLLKPGAVKLCQQFGLAWKLTWKEVQKDWVHGFFYFEAEVTILDRETMVPVGNAIGSCNSREDKYAYRWEWADRCKGIDTSGLKTRRAGKKDDVQYRVPNDDPYSLVNTIQKMAFKRAFVAAVIMATGTDGIFSSDLDTFSPETLAVLLGDEDEVRTWAKGSAADKRADLVGGLERRLAEAKTDRECYAVGVTMAELARIGQLSKSDADMLRDKIAARRAEPAIVATRDAKPAPKPAPAEAPKAPTSQPEQSAANATPAPEPQHPAASPPPAPASEPKAKPRKRDTLCGDTNDGCTCTRPSGHVGAHHDDRTDAEWGGAS